MYIKYIYIHMYNKELLLLFLYNENPKINFYHYLLLKN